MARPIALITQRQLDLPTRNEAWDSLDIAWTREFWALGWEALPAPNHPEATEALAQRIQPNLIVFSGGGDAATPGAACQPKRDATEAALAQFASESRTPVLAVCRGLQQMSASSGGLLKPVQGHVRVRHGLNWAVPPPSKMPEKVASFHDLGLDESSLPSGWTAIATSRDGGIEAVRFDDPIGLGVMWHPERDPIHLGDLLSLLEIPR